MSDDAPDRDANWVESVRHKLVAWYQDAQRDLPWRRNRDPYRVLVSEMMLVQTTVAAVVPYFERFLARFPTIEALAQAEEGEVLKQWEGLGYYRRARQLHAAARAVVERHGGRVPDDPEALRALPGVGRYIAGAVRSFAYDQPAPILEANTQRVLARWLAWGNDLKSTASQTRLWDAATRLVPPRSAGEFNQAFMELGALVCAPRAPSCLFCPVSAECRARQRGVQESLPVIAPKAPPLEVEEACALVVRSGRVLIVQRAPGGLWEGFWEFPTVHLAGADPGGRSFGAPVDLTEGVRRLTGVNIRLGPLAHSLRYPVTKHRVRLDAYHAAGMSERSEPGPGLVTSAWEWPESLANYPLGSASRRLATWLVKHLAASVIPKSTP